MSGNAVLREQVLRLSRPVYDLEAVKRAAYRFIDLFAAEIRVEGDELVCHLTFTPPVTPEAASEILADLRKEITDQDLRRSISAETAPLRNAILAIAFAPARLKSRE